MKLESGLAVRIVGVMDISGIKESRKHSQKKSHVIRNPIIGMPIRTRSNIQRFRKKAKPYGYTEPDTDIIGMQI